MKHDIMDYSEYCYRPRTHPHTLKFSYLCHMNDVVRTEEAAIGKIVSYREHKSAHYECCRSNKHVWGWDLWERLCITQVKQPWFTSLWAHPKRQNYPESGFPEVSPCWTSDYFPATTQMCFTAIRNNSNTSRARTVQAVVTCRVVRDVERD